MSRVPQASGRPQQKRAGPPRKALTLTDSQREVLRDVWTWLVATAGEGKGVHPGFKIHSFALQLCFPRAGKWTTKKPAAYQAYAHDVRLRPWATDGEKQLVFVVLSSMEWSDRANTWTLKRPIAEFANQLSCGRTRINDALNAQRDSDFPILQIDNTPSFERAGQRYKGALSFSLVRDPWAFAIARDKARVPRQTAEDERSRQLHGEVVKLQIAKDRGEITSREFSQRRALLTNQIRWGSVGTPAPLVAVEPPEVEAPAPDEPPAVEETDVPLRAKERRAAFDRVTEIYPKAVELEADGRRRALERWELLRPTARMVEAMLADINRRSAAPRAMRGWADEEPRYRPDLLTYLRDELWTVAQ